MKLDRARADLATARKTIRSTEEKYAAQIARLQVAVNNMSQGLCMFGPDRRLIISNTRYAELYGIPHDQVQPGMTLTQILANRLAAGNIPTMGEDELVSLLGEVA